MEVFFLLSTFFGRHLKLTSDEVWVFFSEFVPSQKAFFFNFHAFKHFLTKHLFVLSSTDISRIPCLVFFGAIFFHLSKNNTNVSITMVGDHRRAQVRNAWSHTWRQKVRDFHAPGCPGQEVNGSMVIGSMG